MATSPTIDPSVAAAIMPALEAGKQITDQYLHLARATAVSFKNSSVEYTGVCVRFLTAYAQVMTSRLMEQLSEPAVLLARQMYFPDMLLVRLLSLRVPCLSSATTTAQLHTRHNLIFM